MRRGRGAPLADRAPADARDRATLLAGTAAMIAFVLLGSGTATGWVEAPVGLPGGLGALVVYVAMIVRAHRAA